MFIGMVGQRPEAIALLKQLMVARGLKPEMKEDRKELFQFGVEGQ
jgi:hypothetical protein